MRVVGTITMFLLAAALVTILSMAFSAMTIQGEFWLSHILFGLPLPLPSDDSLRFLRVPWESLVSSAMFLVALVAVSGSVALASGGALFVTPPSLRGVIHPGACDAGLLVALTIVWSQDPNINISSIPSCAAIGACGLFGVREGSPSRIPGRDSWTPKCLQVRKRAGRLTVHGWRESHVTPRRPTVPRIRSARREGRTGRGGCLPTPSRRGSRCAARGA
jgi:hypothetical protein